MSGFQVYSKGSVPHFVTCTIVEWSPVFTSQAFCDILLESLAFCRERKSLRIHDYVIMPSHLHALISSGDGLDLAKTLGEFKTFTSHRISTLARAQNLSWCLRAFAIAGREAGQDYKVWQDGSHPEEVYSDEFYQQKAE